MIKLKEFHKKEIKALLRWRSTVTSDNPELYQYWEVMIRVLSENKQRTIDLINRCTPIQGFWLSEMFEDISLKMQSRRFLVTIKNLQARYPKLDLKFDIEQAEKALKD